MNNRTTPKDFFLHLGATIALYSVAIAIINLCFSSINYAFPDVLAGYFSPSSIVWPTSILIIIAPTLYVLEWFIHRDLQRNPDKKEIWIRRWRIYLTLFITGFTILGDLIALLNTFLNGEISARFIYKVLVVLIVASVVFIYYLLERSGDMTKSIFWQRIIGSVGIVVILAAIISGFVIVGSPAKQRALRLDSQRVNDLSSIQWQIISFWQQKQRLPSTLAELQDPLSSTYVPTDPVSKQNYQYSIKSPNSFELCAVFAESLQDLKGRGGYYGQGYDMVTSYPGRSDNESWKHEAGQYCFARTVDPDRYPPLKR